MVEFVDDDDVVRGGVDGVEVCAREGLDRREEMFAAARALPINEELAETRIVHYLGVGATSLAQDLRPMRDEEQARSFAGVTQTRVVEGCDDRLAGSCRRDDEVAMAVV